MSKAIEARDLRGARKDKLVDVVPLPAPWTMFVEPTNVCNFRCRYCPTGDTDLLRRIGRKPKLMDFDLYTRIIDGIAEFGRPLRQLNLYKDGESLIHPRFFEMARYAKNAGVSERIWLKTNGGMLNPERNRALVSCGLDMIGISVQHVSARGFYEVAQTHIDYDAYRANILDLYQRRGNVQVSIKIADVGLSESDKQKFYDDFSDRCDFITIEGLHGWSASDLGDWRMGTENSFDGTPRTHKTACPLVLYMLTVSANGDVSICNDDFGHWHGIGSASAETIPEIWRGERLRQFRLMHLTGRRAENRACGTCDYLAALPDTIDEHLEELTRRIA